ncbi:MAG TPA: hypothetical protein GXX19_11315 [Syntrophomonadaceae bacterium]|nr:hypothetical protein [Syntrophomonadaceae bacterium]
MKKVFPYFVCVCLTVLLTLGSLFAGNQVNPNGSNYKGYSLTYKMPYQELEQELLYARIIRYSADGRETTALLRDKGQLVAIVREFDRLKEEKGFRSPLGRPLEESVVVTMWRRGSSVSYVIRAFPDGYFYQERSMGGLADDGKRQEPCLKRLTPVLVRLLGLSTNPNFLIEKISR